MVRSLCCGGLWFRVWSLVFWALGLGFSGSSLRISWFVVTVQRCRVSGVWVRGENLVAHVELGFGGLGEG